MKQRRTRKVNQSPESLWIKAINKNPRATQRDYNMSSQFHLKEMVNHPTFGLGVVESSAPNHMTVIFKEGAKRLAQNVA